MTFHLLESTSIIGGIAVGARVHVCPTVGQGYGRCEAPALVLDDSPGSRAAGGNGRAYLFVHLCLVLHEWHHGV